MRRPAEIGTGAAAALVFVAGRIFEWDGELQGAMTILVGAVPGLISWVVDLYRDDQTSDLWLPPDG